MTDLAALLATAPDDAGTGAAPRADDRIAQWCFAHWWMFALGGGFYIVFRVAMAVLNMVVLFRQGFLARADK